MIENITVKEKIMKKDSSYLIVFLILFIAGSILIYMSYNWYNTSITLWPDLMGLDDFIMMAVLIGIGISLYVISGFLLNDYFNDLDEVTVIKNLEIIKTSKSKEKKNGKSR